MELEIQTMISEVVETKIQVPCYKYDATTEMYHYISEAGDLINVGNHTVAYWPAEFESTKGQIAKICRTAHACIEADFKTALDRVLFKVEEVYTK